MTFRITQVRSGDWYWYLQSANGKKTGIGGEGFTSLQGCLRSIALVLKAARQSDGKPAPIFIRRAKGWERYEKSPKRGPRKGDPERKP